MTHPRRGQARRVLTDAALSQNRPFAVEMFGRGPCARDTEDGFLNDDDSQLLCRTACL